MTKEASGNCRNLLSIRVHVYVPYSVVSMRINYTFCALFSLCECALRAPALKRVMHTGDLRAGRKPENINESLSDIKQWALVAVNKSFMRLQLSPHNR